MLVRFSHLRVFFCLKYLRNVSSILPTARSEFIAAHFDGSGTTSTAESARGPSNWEHSV